LALTYSYVSEKWKDRKLQVTDTGRVLDGRPHSVMKKLTPLYDFSKAVVSWSTLQLLHTHKKKFKNIHR